MEILRYSICDSPVGPLAIVVSDAGLRRLEFHPAGRAPLSDRPRAHWIHDSESTVQVRTELEEYFARRRRQFNVALDLHGTEFQMLCWQELLKIPYGETRSYADIARAIHRPQAFRAVGLANHDNPVAIIVPCHRVVASNGSLCGYGGGLEIKRQLLELEGVCESPWQTSFALG